MERQAGAWRGRHERDRNLGPAGRRAGKKVKGQLTRGSRWIILENGTRGGMSGDPVPVCRCSPLTAEGGGGLWHVATSLQSLPLTSRHFPMSVSPSSPLLIHVSSGFRTYMVNPG